VEVHIMWGICLSSGVPEGTEVCSSTKGVTAATGIRGHYYRSTGVLVASVRLTREWTQHVTVAARRLRYIA
jgi:hypothetical protein